MSNLAAVYAFVILQLFGSSCFVLILILTEIHYRRRRGGRRKARGGDGGASADDDANQLARPPYPAWRSFCVSWVVFGYSYGLLTVTGKQFSSVSEGHSTLDGSKLCAAQAAFIYSTSPLIANTGVALIVQLRSVILYGMGKVGRRPLSRFSRIIIVVIPWILWVINFSIILVYALLNPTLVELNPEGTYCHLERSAFSQVMGAWLALAACIVVGIEVSLILLMHRQGFRLASQYDASRIALRLGVFMLQAIVSIGFALVFVITNSGSATLDILIAIQPSVAAIIFGMRKDIFCLRSRHHGDLDRPPLRQLRLKRVMSAGSDVELSGGENGDTTTDSWRESTIGRMSWQQVSSGHPGYSRSSEE